MSAELELFVLEGQPKGEARAIRAEQVELGRRDPFHKDDPPGRISFPDPTVSGLHATLSWDARRNRYLLTHHSTTNHTLINGKVVQGAQYIHVGDKIKLGGLVLQLRLTPKADAPVPEIAPSHRPPALVISDESSRAVPQLLILNGPEGGKLHPLEQETLILQEPGSHQTFDPTLNLTGAGSTRCLLLTKGNDVHVTCAEAGARPILIDQPLGGVIRQRSPGPEFGNLLTSDSLLLVGRVAVLLLPHDKASEARTRLLAGEQVSTLQSGLFHEGDRIWNRGELHLLNFTSGPLKGTHFWIDHRKVDRPISLGRIGQKTLVELTDRGAVSCEIAYRNDGMLLTNVDPELNLALNQDELSPGKAQELQSGDCFRLGRTVIRYSYLPLQQRIDSYSLFWGSKEFPLRRTINLIGSASHCDIHIEDERLVPLTGRLVVTESSLRYQHRQAGLLATVQGKEIRAGEETPLRLEHTIELGAIHLRLGRRAKAGDDPLEG